MSHSMYSAGRSAHLKIVVVSLICATAFAVVGITARVGEMNGARAKSRIQANATLIRAGGPKAVTSNERNAIR